MNHTHEEEWKFLFQIQVVDLAGVKTADIPADVRKDMEYNGRFIGDKYYLMEGDVDIAYPWTTGRLMDPIIVETLCEDEISDEELLRMIEGGE